MQIKGSNSNFESCPECTGRGVCVDVTPLRRLQSQFGERDVFKLVFEVDIQRDDGSPFCVWSRNFTPSLNEKANFRKFLRTWFGRDLTAEELSEFETETLIGKPAQLVVVHEHKDDDVYANIASCTPDKSGSPLKPSGKFVRAKDREQKPTGGYRRTEQPAQTASKLEDLGATKVHVGKCKGLEIRDLSVEQVTALAEKWLPAAKTSAKPTADDRRLIAALEWWQSENLEKDDLQY